MREWVDDRAAARRLPARVVTTLAAWLAAFLLVTALLSLFGDELASLPLALRALVMSGVLMTVMTTVVMPAVSVAVGRWLVDSTGTGSPGEAQHTRSGTSAVPEPGNEPEPTGPRAR
jgi:antibiotic biosynthesis monooxygenase (ABM) superfamily enzyme